MKREGCSRLRPSLWTTFLPETTGSRMQSTRWSGRRFTSSTYRTFRFALPNRPGWSLLTPSRKAASESMVPRSPSSVAPMGSSTMRIRLRPAGRPPSAARRPPQEAQRSCASPGSQLNSQPSTYSTVGSMSPNALTIVDLPEPFGPEMRTPPSLGSMAPSMSAVFTLSWPTTAVKG